MAAADWGTSHLRVWLLDEGGQPLTERRWAEGLEAAARIGFDTILENLLAAAGARGDLPVIVCGMAGSRQGWQEAPYVPVPVTIADILAGAVIIPHPRRRIRLVPGLAQTDRAAADVMRGEETQLAGAFIDRPSTSWIACMPGTHCKWVKIDKGQVTEFGTWLTGELFSLLSSSSILRHAMRGSRPFVATDPAFHQGLETALNDPQGVTRQLFRIRAGNLLHDLQPTDALASLSGLLIGTEIAAARSAGLADRAPLMLIASGPLRDLYSEALRRADLGPFSVADADEAVRAGLFAAASRHFGSSG